jgi:serine/threonine protein kinase/tetratricopeptide (TPR) repeat protein
MTKPNLPSHDHTVPNDRRRPRGPARSGSSCADRPRALPEAGDSLFGFRLRQELGRGAFAHVFLAEQEDLAGRPVVLKVSPIEGDEPQTLAQLQHTHIVPIYSVHEDRDQDVRGVCMPYFGGANLSRVLQAVWQGPRPVRGAELVRALRAVSSPPPFADKETGRQGDKETGCQTGPAGGLTGESAPHPEQGPVSSSPCLPVSLSPCLLLEGMSYVRAAAWVTARLAEALQHAHQRGVLHHDVKPSNILLGADGQPMLLDFNVSQNRRRDQAQVKVTVGGTIAYMAPEHLRAFCGAETDGEVDHRADIYSLGIVLYEMLVGGKPFDQSGSYSPRLSEMAAMALERSRRLPSLRPHRPDVPWSLESIFRMCLAPDRDRRYRQAEHLAEDLRRFLDDRPLRHAPELSRVERVRKWTRRHPRLTSSAPVALAAALVLGAAGAALASIRQHLADTRAELWTTQAKETMRAYEAGTVRALCLVNAVTDVQDHFARGVAVCEQTLALYHVLDRDDWQQAPDWRRLEEGQRLRLAEDTRELLLSLAWGRVRTRPGDRDALREAVALTDRADAIEGLGPSRALWEGRAYFLEQLGLASEARAARDRALALVPASARDHYLLAITYARSRQRYADAIAQLDRALELNPTHYWSAAQRGICHQEMGEYTQAAGDFGRCIGLWPEFAWGYFNRGCVLERSGNRPDAIRDYTRALERDPEFVSAYLNRGLARLEEKQYGGALEDLDRAAGLGLDDAFLHTVRGMALEKLQRHGEADRAFAEAFARTPKVPKALRQRIVWLYGFAVWARLPGKAWEAFGAVLQDDPHHVQALYGRAMLLVDQGREREAIACFDQALEHSPGFLDARRYRAILYARAGNFDSALQDINCCLVKDPRSGPNFYAAACVAARAVPRSSGAAARQATDQALQFLQSALACGHGRDKAAQDPDLASLRTDPRFLALLQPADQPTP